MTRSTARVLPERLPTSVRLMRSVSRHVVSRGRSGDPGLRACVCCGETQGYIQFFRTHALAALSSISRWLVLKSRPISMSVTIVSNFTWRRSACRSCRRVQWRFSARHRGGPARPWTRGKSGTAAKAYIRDTALRYAQPAGANQSGQSVKTTTIAYAIPPPPPAGNALWQPDVDPERTCGKMTAVITYV